MSLSKVGADIREARGQRGFTQQQLAEAAGVSRYTVIKLEKGSASDIQYKTLAAILAVLGLELSVIEQPVSGLPVLGEP